MSKVEIIAELPKLSHQERREVMFSLIEMEEEAQILADCDRRADEQFQMLDAMEAADAKNKGR